MTNISFFDKNTKTDNNIKVKVNLNAYRYFYG